MLKGLKAAVRRALRERGWTLWRFLGEAAKNGLDICPGTYYNVLTGRTKMFRSGTKAVFRELLEIDLDEYTGTHK